MDQVEGIYKLLYLPDLSVLNGWKLEFSEADWDTGMQFNCNSLFGYKIWARAPKLVDHLFGGVLCYRNGFFALEAKGWIHFLGVVVDGLDRRTNTWGEISTRPPF